MKEGEKRKKLIETLNKIIADLEGGYDGFLYLYDTLCNYDNAQMTPEEIGATLDKVQKLYAFYKNNKRVFYAIGRKNGKSRLAYRLMREYTAVLSAYEKVERKIKTASGYLPQTAIKQIYYIIKYKAAEATASLRLRLKLWFTKKTDCKRCCLRCEYYEMCACDYLSTEVEHKGYTVVQSGLNNHISIYDAEGRAVYHAQQSKRQSEQALRETVDFYLYMREEAGK